MDFIFANSPYLKKFVEFYFAKTKSAKISIFLTNIPQKICSFKVIKDLIKLYIYIYIDKCVQCILFLMCRHLLIRVNSKEIFQFLRVQFNNLWIFKKFCNVYFIKPLEDDRIPTDIDINERFEVNESLWFLCKKRFLYLGTTVKLWTY